MGGMLFIYLLVFVGMWAFTRSPLIAGGIVAVLWSVLSFFSDTAEENKAEARRDSEYQQQGDLFHNGEDE